MELVTTVIKDTIELGCIEFKNGIFNYMQSKQLPKVINLQSSTFVNFVDFLTSQGKDKNIGDYKAIRISPVDFAKLPDEQIVIKDIYQLMNGNYDEIDVNLIDGLTEKEIEEIKNEFDNIQRNKINPADMIIFDVKRIKETKKIVNEFLKTTKKTNKQRINLIDKLYDDGLVYTVSLKQPKNGVDVKLYTPKPCDDISINIESFKKEIVSFTNRKTINDLNNRSRGIFSSRNCNLGIITYTKDENGNLENNSIGGGAASVK